MSHPSECPRPHSQPPLLAGLRSDDLLRRAVRRTGSAGRIWEPPAVADLAVLLPQYRIEALAGRGGMGAVYRAWHPALDRRVAIKFLAPALTDDDLFRDRFRREARLLGRLHHPGIVEVYETGETADGGMYYTMEFVAGTDLAQCLQAGPVAWPRAVEILQQVAQALTHAHGAGVVHRDLKPSNILLAEFGQVKIADFGLAAPGDAGVSLALTLTGTALGTLEYAAPEQIEGRPADHRADIFSLGVIGYELLTGARPRGAFDPPSVQNPELDPAFDGVILQALRTQPERRFANAEEFAVALGHAADRRVQQERREKELRAKVARRARMVAALLAVAVITAGSAVYAWIAKQEANERRTAAEDARLAAETAQAGTESVIQFLLTDLRKRLEKTGNLDAMETVLERAVKHFREKYGASQQDPDAAVQLADALVVKGDVLAARDLDGEAMASFAEALALVDAARTAEPANPARSIRVVQALGRCADQHQDMGLYAEALEDARRMQQEAEGLSGTAARRLEAAAHRTAAFALSWLEQLDECRAEYLIAQKILTRLAAEDPADASIAFDLAGLDMSLGNLAQKQWRFPLMLDHYQAWHEWAKKSQGTESQYYAHTCTRLAYAYVFNRRPAEALAVLVNATRIATRECEAKPGNKDALNLLYYTLLITADAQLMIGQEEESRATRAKVAEVQAAQAAPARPAAVLPPAEELKKRESREADAFKALTEDPENESAQEAWATACRKLGLALESVHGPAASTAHYARQFERAESLRKAAPVNSWWNLSAARMAASLAQCQERDGQISEAEASWRRALGMNLCLAVAWPVDTRLRPPVCECVSSLCGLLIAQKRAPDAAALITPVLSTMAPLEQDTFSEWRAVLAGTAREVMKVLPPQEAMRLAEASRAFLATPGGNHMTTGELANLAAVERIIAGIPGH